MSYFQRHTFQKKLLGTLLMLPLVGLVVVLSFVIYTYPSLPDAQQLRQVELQVPLRIYDKHAELIGEFGEKRRTPIKFDDIPQYFIDALLAAEDDDFYAHFGISITGLFRAAYQLISTGSIQSGGSTITMQVARNFFLTREQTFTRKFKEILLALKIEREMDKNEILSLYANKIYFGKRAYGIASAANVYYGKPISELNLSQLAMIAGLPKAPSRYNPVNNPQRAKIRRDWILGRMKLLNYIDEALYQQELNRPISASNHGAVLSYDAIFATELVRRELKRQFGDSVYEQGLQVYTTIDVNLQRIADQSVRQGILNYDLRHGYRGEEARFNINDIELNESDNQTPITINDDSETSLSLQFETESTTTSLDYLPEVWATQLNQYQSIGELIPAVVISVSTDSAVVATRDASTMTLTWEQGLSSARRFITADQRGPAPKQASDVVQLGDVVRLRLVDDNWHLSQKPQAQAALVSLNSEDGSIIAITGGFDFYSNSFNRASQALRQPGSNFKPMLYAIAMENGFTAATLVNDAPIVFDDKNLEDVWRPSNDSDKFYGPTRLRHALTWSRNLVSIRVLQSLGISKARKGLKKFGFSNEDLPRNLTLSLGSQAMTPLKVASAYASFANNGYRIEPYIIDYILDREGTEVFRAFPYSTCNPCEDDAYEPAERILDERVVYVMDSILKDVIKKGTGRRARVLQRSDIAGKTGTTNGPKDAWFTGYNPDIVTTTWIGFDNNQLLGRREAGGSAALPIWIDFMREALKNIPERHLPLPDNLVKIRIDKDTGLRASLENKNAIFEYFLRENVPPELPKKYIDNKDNESLSEQIF